MTDLIVCLTEEKGYKHVRRLILEADWTRIFVVTREDVKNKFVFAKPVVYIIINPKMPIQDMISHIKSKLTFLFGEVGLNLVSGNGKEHMAIVGAIMKSGAGFRMVAMTPEGMTQL